MFVFKVEKRKWEGSVKKEQDWISPPHFCKIRSGGNEDEDDNGPNKVRFNPTGTVIVYFEKRKLRSDCHFRRTSFDKKWIPEREPKKRWINKKVGAWHRGTKGYKKTCLIWWNPGRRKMPDLKVNKKSS